jgi:hypothetical protein
MLRDLKNMLSLSQSLAPKARTASENGAVVDTQGAKSVMAVIASGAYTDGTHTPKLQEGDVSDGSDAADVAAGDLEGAFTAIAAGGDANKMQKVGYKGSKRYVRLVMTCAGTTSGALSGGCIVIEPNAKPAA